MAQTLHFVLSEGLEMEANLFLFIYPSMANIKYVHL